ncbi:hypothetical protein [Nonomuraea africana]|uniref:DeoR/GlpR family transcriptional regulator of sugar metabolism n=1 Tax=Nonomuraea africana TaxID=46171 RepID=A0ABR9KXB6_9ACTN|nr:hypothetical protein [Nonomuraea africana]MBE1566400.1 DeoR/GlpR family transcriptional regulator of sugar metabolism [Nonomuraea africana]
MIVVADGSKLGKRAFARISPLAQINVLVTDSTAPPDLVTRLGEAGVRVVQV